MSQPGAGPSTSTAGPSTAGPSTAGPSTAGPSTAGPSRAGLPADSDQAGAGRVAADPPASASWSGQRGTPTRLLLLRHGQTALSVHRRYSGRGNPELTELGLAQADGVAEGIRDVEGADRVAAVLTSPLRRAQQTADPVAAELSVPVTEAEGLVETDFGAWEGLTFAEAAARDPELHRRWLGDETVQPPGGESFAEVGLRVAALRDRLLAEYSGQTLILVSHVTPIKMLLRLALDVGASVLYRLHLDLASLSIAEFYPDGGASVRLVNGRFGVARRPAQPPLTHR